MLKTLFVLAALIATSMLVIPTASLALTQVAPGAAVVA
jgi:hypothetical protein